MFYRPTATALVTQLFFGRDVLPDEPALLRVLIKRQIRRQAVGNFPRSLGGTTRRAPGRSIANEEAPFGVR